jgi:hypothetical protein
MCVLFDPEPKGFLINSLVSLAKNLVLMSFKFQMSESSEPGSFLAHMGGIRPYTSAVEAIAYLLVQIDRSIQDLIHF